MEQWHSEPEPQRLGRLEEPEEALHRELLGDSLQPRPDLTSGTMPPGKTASSTDPEAGKTHMRGDDWQKTWRDISGQNRKFLVENWKDVLGAVTLTLGAVAALAIERLT